MIKKQRKVKKPVNKPAKGNAVPNNSASVQNAQGRAPAPQQKKPVMGVAKLPKKQKKQKKMPLKKQQKPALDQQVQNNSANPQHNSVKKPVAPISGGQKKAYNKAVKNRTVKAKKRGSRGGNYVLYYIFAAIVAIVVFSILAKTVLFNCSSIVVEGNMRYTADEITAASGLVKGTSLLDINEDAAEQRIITSLAYIDIAEVSKSFPTKMIIKVTEAEKWFVVQQNGRPYIVSRMGKIIEESADASLPSVVGYEALEPAVGVYLMSEIDGKTELPEMLLTAAEAAGVRNITSIDITDRFEIKVLVENRITLELGNSNELENKMYIARELIENEITATESVTVNLTNTEKVYVRDNNIIDNPDIIVPVLPENETAEGTAEAGSSETTESPQE